MFKRIAQTVCCGTVFAACYVIESPNAPLGLLVSYVGKQTVAGDGVGRDQEGAQLAGINQLAGIKMSDIGKAIDNNATSGSLKGESGPRLKMRPAPVAVDAASRKLSSYFFADEKTAGESSGISRFKVPFLSTKAGTDFEQVDMGPNIQTNPFLK